MTVYEVHVSLKYADAAEISLPSLYAGASEMPVKARAQVALASVSDGAKGDPGPKGSDGQMLVATSATPAATAAKVATLRSGTLSLKAGASVTVVFSEANTAASPTLNVGGTGAKAIRTNGTPYAYWVAGTAVSFVYDGTYWQVCSVPVYASTVTVGNPGGSNVSVDSDSVDVRKAATVLASFGPELVELGKNSESATIRMLAGLARIVATKLGGISGIEISSGTVDVRGTGGGGMRLYSSFGGDANHASVWSALTGEMPTLYAECTDKSASGGSSAVTNRVTMNPTGFSVSNPSAARAALGLGLTRLYYDYDAGWVVYASDYLVWIYAWGVAIGSGSWDSKACPYVLPEKYRPRLSHITTPISTTNGGSWTAVLTVNSQGQILVKNNGNAGSTEARYGVLLYPVGV